VLVAVREIVAELAVSSMVTELPDKPAGGFGTATVIGPEGPPARVMSSVMFTEPPCRTAAYPSRAVSVTIAAVGVSVFASVFEATCPQPPTASKLAIHRFVHLMRPF
jgi:hypothetical protein